MTTLQLLQQQKAALDAQIAAALKEQIAREKALELQRIKQREDEIAKGTAEIKALMTKYKLSKDDLFGDGRVRLVSTNKGLIGSAKMVKTLEEMRQFYKQF